METVQTVAILVAILSGGTVVADILARLTGSVR